jgi:hypothetical protein
MILVRKIECVDQGGGLHDARWKETFPVRVIELAETVARRNAGGVWLINSRQS